MITFVKRLLAGRNCNDQSTFGNAILRMALGEAIKCAINDPAVMAETGQGVDRIAQANAELAADFNLWSAMKEQSKSMLGMAAMFVITIVLGMILQPFYSMAGLEAFGTEGASQVRFILLELVAILVFTALIIMLARWKKEWIIKYGIMFIIFIALSYSTVPLAHYLVAPHQDPTALEWTQGELDSAEMMDFLGPDDYISSTKVVNSTSSQFTIAKHNGINPVPEWSVMMHESGSNSADVYLTQDDNFGFTDGDKWWFADPETGVVDDSDNRSCSMILLGPECRMMFTHEDKPYTLDMDGNIHRFHPNSSITSSDGKWQLAPELTMHSGYMSGRIIDDDKILVVTSRMVVFAEIPTESQNLGNDRVTATVDHIWNFTADEENLITSYDWGFSPRPSTDNANATGEEMFLIIGTAAGDVHGFEFNLSSDEASVSAAEWMNLADNDAVNGEVSAIRLADYNFGGINDVFVIDDDGLKMFSGYSLVLRLEDSNVTGNSIMIVNSSTDNLVVVSQFSESSSSAQTAWSHAPINEVNLAQPFTYDDLATLIGVLVSTVLMILLWKHSEWYVVNTVGILVGGGVITMLGTSFVPWLIIIFMVLAAGYDAWAVYHSKHMLELADTMIGLNLPILLVAPQDSDYTMIGESDDRLRSAAADDAESAGDEAATEAAAGESGFKAKSVAADTVHTEKARSTAKAKKKGGQDAMFMGLGDVIFPGMLVISAMTYLAPIGGASAALAVAIGTMIGGLAGYFWLMTYVARGQPQAGLPLLNGGAILGYLISAVAIIGTKALEFNFTF